MSRASDLLLEIIRNHPRPVRHSDGRDYTIDNVPAALAIRNYAEDRTNIVDGVPAVFYDEVAHEHIAHHNGAGIFVTRSGWIVNEVTLNDLIDQAQVAQRAPVDPVTRAPLNDQFFLPQVTVDARVELETARNAGAAGNAAAHPEAPQRIAPEVLFNRIIHMLTDAMVHGMPREQIVPSLAGPSVETSPLYTDTARHNQQVNLLITAIVGEGQANEDSIVAGITTLLRKLFMLEQFADGEIEQAFVGFHTRITALRTNELKKFPRFDQFCSKLDRKLLVLRRFVEVALALRPQPQDGYNLENTPNWFNFIDRNIQAPPATIVTSTALRNYRQLVEDIRASLAPRLNQLMQAVGRDEFNFDENTIAALVNFIRELDQFIKRVKNRYEQMSANGAARLRYGNLLAGLLHIHDFVVLFYTLAFPQQIAAAVERNDEAKLALVSDCLCGATNCAAGTLCGLAELPFWLAIAAFLTGTYPVTGCFGCFLGMTDADQPDNICGPNSPLRYLHRAIAETYARLTIGTSRENICCSGELGREASLVAREGAEAAAGRDVRFLAPGRFAGGLAKNLCQEPWTVAYFGCETMGAIERRYQRLGNRPNEGIPDGLLSTHHRVPRDLRRADPPVPPAAPQAMRR